MKKVIFSTFSILFFALLFNQSIYARQGDGFLGLFDKHDPETELISKFEHPPVWPDDAQSTTGPKPPEETIKKEFPPLIPSSTVTIPNVPVYLWHNGCGPTAAGMVLGYWDGMGFDNLVPGSAASQTAAVNSMISSTGNYNDYCLPIDEPPDPIKPDKSEPPVGDEHGNDSISDFMKTSQSYSTNYYGWSWYSDMVSAFTGYVSTAAPGYSTIVTNLEWGALTWENYKFEIDSGRPIVLLVDTDANGGTDHFVTAIGYSDEGGMNRYACFDTWDEDVHWYEFAQMDSGQEWGIYGSTFFQIHDPSIYDKQVFLPLTLNNYSSTPLGIHGQVKQNGTNASGVPLDLLSYDGSSYTTVMTTTTASDGTFQFIDVPSLNPGQTYFVLYLNLLGESGRLHQWITRELDSYILGSDIDIGTFDIADIPLVSPADLVTVTLPQVFQWTRRSATTNDSYEWNIFDQYGGPWWWTDPALGYVDNYTFNSLPAGFSTGTEYGWNVWVYSPDGGYGISHYYRRVSFSNSSNPLGIHGQVKQNGLNASGVPLDLRFYDGSSYSTLMSTTTASDGTFQFIDVPSLNPGQIYYVRYLNLLGESGRLWMWGTRELDSYILGSDVDIGTFDIADIPLVSPADTVTVSLPQVFQWTRRSATTNDSYEWNIFDPNDLDPWWWTYPALGYVDNYTFNSLPAGFYTGTEYAWEVWVYSPDGGYGISYDYRYISFSNSGLEPGKVYRDESSKRKLDPLLR